MIKEKVLIIDDEAPIRSVLAAALVDEGYQVQTAQDGASGLKAIKDFEPRVVFLDIWMPGQLDGLEVLKQSRSMYPQVDIIMMSGHGTIETAVKATKWGAWDFIEKPLSMDKILLVLQNILSLQKEKQEKSALLNRLRRNIAIVGESAEMVAIKQLISRVAPTDSNAFIQGDSGTGKGLVAENLHYLSQRASGQFVEFNCASVPPDLVEMELFGYEKGSFPGAEHEKKGKFDLAHRGTLYLEEISFLDLSIQAKLLKIQRDGVFYRFGGTKGVPLDVRMMASSSADLEKLVREGKFREDLYYKLNIVPIRVPSLQQRLGDIPALVSHFSDMIVKDSGYRHKTFSSNALDKMRSYPWPGNVRELKNFVERVYILTQADFIDVYDVEFAGLDVLSSSDGQDPKVVERAHNFRDARAQFEKEYLIEKIRQNQGNISKTAEAIGLERSYLHRKIKAYGIEVDV